MTLNTFMIFNSNEHERVFCSICDAECICDMMMELGIAIWSDNRRIKMKHSDKAQPKIYNIFLVRKKFKRLKYKTLNTGRKVGCVSFDEYTASATLLIENKCHRWNLVGSNPKDWTFVFANSILIEQLLNTGIRIA